MSPTVRYHIPVGTLVRRSAGRGWGEPFATTKPVTYDETDLAKNTPEIREYFIFNLPLEALPYLKLLVKRGAVMIWQSPPQKENLQG